MCFFFTLKRLMSNAAEPEMWKLRREEFSKYMKNTFELPEISSKETPDKSGLEVTYDDLDSLPVIFYYKPYKDYEGTLISIGVVFLYTSGRTSMLHKYAKAFEHTEQIYPTIK